MIIIIIILLFRLIKFRHQNGGRGASLLLINENIKVSKRMECRAERYEMKNDGGK